MTPVHGRTALTSLVLQQRAELINELAVRGISARQVVVGDDGNLGTARELGFDVLERPNVLGRKLNDGIEYACRAGADFVCFTGSDDWMHPDWCAALPRPDKVRASRLQAFVSPGGDRLIVKRWAGSMGGAPWIVPAHRYERWGYRPVRDEHRMSGMDGQLGMALQPEPLPASYASPEDRQRRQAAKRATLLAWDHLDDDPLRMVDFKGRDEQITRWHSLLPADNKTLVIDTDRVWETLATRYPPHLVAATERHYGC